MNKELIGNVLALCCLILYSLGYQICEFFYEDNIESWRSLRDLLTGIMVFIMVNLNSLPKTKIRDSINVSFWWFCFGNLVDRLLFDIDKFVFSDYLLWLTAIVAGLITYHVKRRSLE